MLDAYVAHDLLKIRVPHDCSGLPSWAYDSLTQAPWVVVRRAESVDNKIPVGIRGRERSQRQAWWVEPSLILERRTPRELRARIPYMSTETLAAKALHELYYMISGLDWGPTGSAGFELATGLKTMHNDSDLDLCFTYDNEPAVVQLEKLQQICSALPVQVDAHIVVGKRSAALAELVSGSPHVLVRTDQGPQLCAASGWVEAKVA